MALPSPVLILTTGFLGGIVGAVITFILTEIWIRKPRERLGIAEALAAELTNAASDLKTFLDDEDPHEIPPYFRTSHVVFDALASRLADLDYGDILRTDCSGLATHLRTKYTLGLRRLIPLRLRPSKPIEH